MKLDREKLDARISALQAKLDKLTNLREALDDEDVVQELEEAFSANGSSPTPAPRRRRGRPASGKPTAFSRIEKFFNTRENEWATIAEISDGTGIVKPSVRQILYKAKVDSFDRVSQEGFGKASSFRLKEE